MSAPRSPIPALLGLALITGCAAGEPQPEAAAPVAMWAVTTPSEEARREAAAGVYALDLSSLPGNLAPSQRANEAFRRAIAVDPSFAFAYLGAAVTAPSQDEFRANLERAGELARGASPTERLLIEIQRQVLQRDLEGAREAVLQLRRSESANPRVWLELARIQSEMGEEEEARKSATRAVEIAPDFVAAHMWLGDSHAARAPQDLSRAEVHAQKAVELQPRESTPYDLRGDVHRAKGELAEAAGAYARAAELDTTNALVLQQRGHVNSFLGKYAQSRADYDAAFARGRGNSKANFRTFRALVHVHEGNPRAAVEELERLLKEMDAIPMEDPDAMKDFVLLHQAIIALHVGLLDDAERAITRRNVLLRSTANRMGTDGFRRAREAEATVWEGLLAAFRGDHAAATGKGREAMRLREADRDPTRNRAAHDLLGLVALRQEKYAEAVSHFEQGDPNNFYFNHQHALALEGAGRTDEAKKLFRKIAGIRFNSAPLLLVRRDAIAKSR